MKHAVLLVVMLLPFTDSLAKDVAFKDHTVEVVEERKVPKIISLTSPVHQVDGSAAAIIQRAHGCVARLLVNDEVKTSGSSASGFFGAVAGQGRNVSGSVAGGSVIELSDPESGLLVANSRVDYKFMLIAHSARSRFTIEARDGRFRIVQSNLESLQKNSGNMPNDDYSPMIQRRGTGWDKALEAMTEAEAKVVDCIARAQEEEW